MLLTHHDASARFVGLCGLSRQRSGRPNGIGELGALKTQPIPISAWQRLDMLPSTHQVSQYCDTIMTGLQKSPQSTFIACVQAWVM